MSAPVLYTFEATYGEKDWGWGVGFGQGLVYSATESGDSIDYHQHYQTVIGRAASGGSYVDTNATTDGSTIALNRTDYLNWPVGSPPLGIDFGWPWLTDHVTVTAYVRGSGNTPFVAIVNGQGSLNSNGPAIELGGRLILQRGSLGTIDISGTTIGFANDTYSGATQNATPIMVDGIPYTPAYQYSLGSDVHQNGGSSHTTYTATAAISTTIQTWIKQGQAPVAIIDPAPVPVLVPDQAITLKSRSYDPDNGSTAPDSGIWSTKWTITGPDGFSAESSESEFPVALSSPGLYTVMLHVVDDEGMTGDASTTVEVVAPRLAVDPSSIDFGTVSWSNPAERTFRIRNNGHPLTRLDVTLSFDGSPAFSVSLGSRATIVGGDSIEVTVRLAPISPLTGPVEGHVTVMPLDAFNAPVVVDLAGDVASPVPHLIQTTKGVPRNKDGSTLIELHAVHHIVSSTGNGRDLRGIKFREHLTFPDDVRWFFDLDPSGYNPREWSGYPYVNIVRAPGGRWEVVIDDANGVYDARFWRSDWNAVIPNGISYLTVQQFEWWSPWTNDWLPLGGGAFLIDRTLIPPSVTGDTTWIAVISKGGVSEAYRLEEPLAYPDHWLPAPGTAAFALAGSGHQTPLNFVSRADSTTPGDRYIAAVVLQPTVARPTKVWHSLALRNLQLRLWGLLAHGTGARLGEQWRLLTFNTLREMDRTDLPDYLQGDKRIE